ncbi:MAG TPA: hypothetical protein VK968_19845 [Roseimicrobium sp.]|nr:hypothetical protein [Roseimicrobium sp.]
MTPADDRFLGRPASVDEFMRCIIWPGWHANVAFTEGSKSCLNLKPSLIRPALAALSRRHDLGRYTHALCKIVRTSQPDEALQDEWRTNLPLLRALLYTSPVGTERQREKLLDIARNARVISAMRHALRKEITIDPRTVEPSWIAVLYAEHSKASVREADRFNTLLRPEMQTTLRAYLGDLT